MPIASQASHATVRCAVGLGRPPSAGRGLPRLGSRRDGMPISRRYLVTSTLLLLLIAAAALICLVGATVWLSQRAQSDAALIESQRVLRTSAASVREALLGAESSQRGYVLTGNEIYLAPYENSKLVARGELAKLTSDLEPSGRYQAMLPRLRALIDQRLHDLDEAIQLKDAGSSERALDVIGTNHGKALMDEVQVFLSAIVLEAEDAQTIYLRAQTANILALRIGTVLASILILSMIAGVVMTFIRYTREVVEARDELAQANVGLEARVADRTQDLVQARDRAEVLLTEVNHRVANNLFLIGSMIRLQRQSIQEEAAKAALDETSARIQAIAAIHKHLYTSGDVASIALDEYMIALLAQLEQTLLSEGHGASIRPDIEAVRVSTNAGISLGIVITEWVTNAFKYAYEGRPGEIRVSALRVGDKLRVAVADNGTGIVAGAPARGTGVGSKIVTTIAKSLKAEVDYLNLNPGTEACITMPLDAV